MKTDKKELEKWQSRLASAQTAYQGEINLMDEREMLYLGSDIINKLLTKDGKEKTPHVRNIVAELIEAQVDSNIPTPKVTAMCQEDERLAKIIEDMLRNELDRLPFEMINDMCERTAPIQGGVGYLVEWDPTVSSHTTMGEVSVSAIHPKMMLPQDGVYSGIEDMDYIILKLPQTKEYILRKYGIDVSDENESEPDIKGSTNQAASSDLVTQYVAYYRNDKGGIGLYSWVRDVQLEHLDDYQARRLKRCAICGAVEPREELESVDQLSENGLPLGVYNGLYPGMGEEVMPEDLPEPVVRKKGTCPYCGGSKWEDSTEEYEEIYGVVHNSEGEEVCRGTADEPARVPYYKPDIYPIILQKNVSVFGKFLGDSDVDKIASQQNTTNRLSLKIIEKLFSIGSFASLPTDAKIDTGTDDMKVVRLNKPADLQLLGVYNMEGNVSQDMGYLAQVYEEARQATGITDSFQGRADRTATSGKAKEFAAAQSAGRLESKRVMKRAAFEQLFEAIFKFKLAYAEEPRTVVSTDIYGKKNYEKFNKWDFLKKDASGEYYWNDRFLFSCDTAAALASNREAMWQETRMNLQTGAFGDPTQLETLIIFWSKMEMLHYPGAADTKSLLEEKMQKQQQAAQMQQMMAQMPMQGAMPGGATQGIPNIQGST